VVADTKDARHTYVEHTHACSCADDLARGCLAQSRCYGCGTDVWWSCSKRLVVDGKVDLNLKKFGTEGKPRVY
jgi:hypothetical protein